uniref:G protein-coupled receptor n=1 Tax=Heligmosomoides polygyrus TaxID=6339 RepID=A0A8L8KTT6_HELPZ
LFCSRIWIQIYALIQMGVMGWQTQVVRSMQWEYEGRQLPATGGIDAFQARFPGLYAIYTETPERRRINAMFVIVLWCLITPYGLLNLLASEIISVLLNRFPLKKVVFQYHKNFVWPWIFSAGPIIIMSTAYAVLWWSGDVFNEQLTMSVAEFVMSLAVNVGYLMIFRIQENKNNKNISLLNLHHMKAFLQHRSSQPPSRGYTAPVQKVYYQRTPSQRCRPPPVAPIPTSPPSEEKAMRAGGLDFYAPEPYDQKFPWKVDKMERDRRKEDLKPHSTAEAIERLYYNNYPDDLPGIPHGMRSSLRKDRKQGRSPDRVTFSRADPQVNIRTPQESSKNSIV